MGREFFEYSRSQGILCNLYSVVSKKDLALGLLAYLSMTQVYAVLRDVRASAICLTSRNLGRSHRRNPGLDAPL